MLKLTGGLVGLLILLVIWMVRRSAMRKRLTEFDSGKRCIACHSTNVTVANNKARCNACMHTSDLAELRAAVVTDQQIADATRPTDRGL